MATEEEGPRVDRIRPISGADQVTIPGPTGQTFDPSRMQPKDRPFAGPLRAIEITRDQGDNLNGDAKSGVLIAGRVCMKGDVVEVTDPADIPRAPDGRQMRLTVDMMSRYLFPEQADWYVAKNWAISTNKPPTYRPGKPIEEAVNPSPRQAERAVGQRQRGAI